LRSNKAKATAKSWRNTHRNRQASEDGEVKVGSASRKQQRIFLLSPANASGIRAQLILREQARFELAVRLRREGSPLGEVFSFISGLYFRGKLAYSRAFVAAPPAVGGAFVITSSRGLVSPETIARRLADWQETAARLYCSAVSHRQSMWNLCSAFLGRGWCFRWNLSDAEI
jgi:hypothetical protein